MDKDYLEWNGVANVEIGYLDKSATSGAAGKKRTM